MVWAHPRSRGEHRRGCLFIDRFRGSSPLARGTHRVQFWRNHGRGLIPARAGNTFLRLTLPRVLRAHPRSRGEHHRSKNFRMTVRGSSPLARGTHLLTWDFTPYISKIESLWNQSLHPEYTISSHY